MIKQFIVTVTLGAATLAGAGIASADGHNIGDPDITWPCQIGSCSSTGAAWGAPDGAETRDPSWTPAINQGDLVPAVQAIDTSVDTPHNNVPPSSRYRILPNGPGSSWPGSGWGVDDR